jgi:hypothetical protein
MRDVRDWASLLAAIGTLTLGAIAARGARRDPLARAIMALCFVLFGWNISVVAQRLVHSARVFEILDSVSTALSPPLVLEVVIAFIGAAKRHRSTRIGAWCAFGALAATSIVAPDDGWWALAFLVCWMVVFVLQITLLVQYLRRATEAREKAARASSWRRSPLAARAPRATLRTPPACPRRTSARSARSSPPRCSSRSSSGSTSSMRASRRGRRSTWRG